MTNAEMMALLKRATEIKIAEIRAGRHDVFDKKSAAEFRAFQLIRSNFEDFAEWFWDGEETTIVFGAMWHSSVWYSAAHRIAYAYVAAKIVDEDWSNHKTNGFIIRALRSVISDPSFQKQVCEEIFD